MRSAPIVLMYHGVDTVGPARDPDNLFVPLDSFTGQLEHLRRRGYQLLSEDDYLQWLDGGRSPSRSVLLTFDDGYRSVLTNAAPALKAAGAPAVCYVCPGMLGRTSTWMPHSPDHALMTGEEVQRLAEFGVAVGVHGHDHTAMDTLTADELPLHTVDATARVAELVGHPPRTFAYPYGAHSEQARDAVRSAGLAAAFAVYSGEGRWAVPRVDVNAVDTPRTFALKLLPAYPGVRRTLSRFPSARKALHAAVGRARR